MQEFFKVLKSLLELNFNGTRLTWIFLVLNSDKLKEG